MIERVEAILREKAQELAGRNAPGRVHLHAAANDVVRLVLQARDRLLSPPRPAAVAGAEPAPVLAEPMAPARVEPVAVVAAERVEAEPVEQPSEPDEGRDEPQEERP